MKLSAVILAAGYGKRMRSTLPKVLHPLAGIPMLQHTLRAVAAVTEELPVVVVGHGADEVRRVLGSSARFVTQAEQLGTAHALSMAEPLLRGQTDLVLLATGDMPLLTGKTFQKLIEAQQQNNGPITLLTVINPDSHGFGRVVRAADGSVLEIVEEAQAAPEILAIQELNASVYCFESAWLWDALKEIKISPKGEYYLTDIVGVAVAQGKRVQAMIAVDPNEALGVNNRVHLAEAESIYRQRTNTYWMEAGVTMIDPAQTYIGPDVQIGQDTILYPGTCLRGQTSIGQNCQIGPYSVLENCQIGDNSIVQTAQLRNLKLPASSEVLPYTFLDGAAANE